MSKIADYIAREQYGTLIEEVLSSEYTNKDRSDVLKYIKRRNLLSKLPQHLIKKLEISCGNFSEIKRCYLHKEENISNYYYQDILGYLSVRDLYNNAKDLFIYDAQFIDSLPLTRQLDNDFLKIIIEDVVLWENSDFLKARLLLWVLTSYVRINCFDFEQLSNCLENKDILKNSLSIAMKEFVEKEKPFILTSMNICKNIIPFYFKYSSEIDDSFLSDVFENACTYGSDIVVDIILNKGFKKIASGFNRAVKYKNIDLVKKMLPYNPPLSGAFKYLNITSKEIADILNEKKAQNKLGRSKSKK